MRQIKVLLALLTVLNSVTAQSVLKTMVRLPDTGETNSYTVTFGEDADFTINEPYIILNGDGTATDTVTGLMWQILDGGEMTFENAITFCDTLTLGGYTGWRLPDAHEAFSILNLQRANPALDPSVFVSTSAEYWWTSDRQLNDTNKIWVTNSGGGIGNHQKSETISAGGVKQFHVRAVRDISAPSLISAHFIDNGDGTITDQLTDLIWEQLPYADTLTWEQALVFADSLNLSGHSDWRLPNIKELQSLSDVSRMNPCINTNYFNISGQKKYWSSTTLPNLTTKAWYLDTRYGITTYDFKTNKHYLFCVRGGTGITTSIESIDHTSTSNLLVQNPIGEKIILFNQSEGTDVELYDAFGRMYFNGTSIQDFDASLLPSGMYFLKVVGSKMTVLRLLKIY